MKKVLLTLVAVTFASAMFAQSKEEKEAAKAAAAAEKLANKEAQKLLDSGLKYYDQAKLKFDEMNNPNLGMYEKDPAKKAAMKEALRLEMMDNCAKGEPIVKEALATGRISEKKLFDAWFKQDFMISQLLNEELGKAGQEIPFDTAKVIELSKQIAEACHYELQYGDKKDDTQKNIMIAVATKFPAIHTYFAYATQFQIQNKNLKKACECFEDYKAFPKKYPEVATSEKVKNPTYPYSQFAFNIYFTAYEAKDYATMAKYHEEAMEYDDEQSKEFVRQSSVQVYLAKGDTVGWANACKEMVKKNPSSETAETYIQNLLAYYSKQGVPQMEQFADEILELVPESKIANYGKGFALFSAQKYEEALKFYKKTVDIDPDYMEGNYQCGTCLYNIGKKNYNTIRDKKYTSQAAADKDAEQKVKVWFRQALPYFEKVKEIEPDDPTRWAGELKVIYENLGMKQKIASLPKDY